MTSHLDVDLIIKSISIVDGLDAILKAEVTRTD